jgi:hypothetical protein
MFDPVEQADFSPDLPTTCSTPFCHLNQNLAELSTLSTGPSTPATIFINILKR